MKRTLNAFVSRLEAESVETTQFGGEATYIPSPRSSVEVHTGIDTFRLPWPLDETMPRIGSTVLLTIETVDE